MLSVDGLSIRLGDFSLDNVSFDVERGRYFVLLGSSGVGKTVVLEAIAGLIAVRSGTIALGGQDITRHPIQKRDIALVYQDQALFPHLSVRDNITYGLRGRRLSKREQRMRVSELAREVSIEHLLARRPPTLSGGEAQRVALARALAVQPRCLLLDEPLSSLDVTARAQMRTLLHRINRDGMTVVHVTHDYEEAISLASHIGILENGTLVQVGSPREVFTHPRSKFTARFVGIRNLFEGDLSRQPTGETAVFDAQGVRFTVLSEEEGHGYAAIRSEDVTISLHVGNTSARNVFAGTVAEIVPGHLGMQVTVDAGVPLCGHLTRESVNNLALRPGSKVFASIKGSAIKFIPA